MKEEHRKGGRKPRKKKKSHRLYAAIVLGLGIVIIALTILILFYVQKIEIKGNDYCTDKEIAELVQNDRFSVNSLYVVGKYALERGETLPCLESMEVSMKNPWTISVKVEEKAIVGYVEKGDNKAYFDKEGLVVYVGNRPSLDVPCVEGISVKNVKLYNQLTSEKTNIFEEILETSKELKKYEMSADKVVCKNDRIYVYVGDVCISFGENVTSEKVAHAQKIMEKLDGQAGTLHLENYDIGNETITFEIEELQEEKQEEN